MYNTVGNVFALYSTQPCVVWLQPLRIFFFQTSKMFDRCTTSTAKEKKEKIIRKSRSTCSNQINKCTYKHGKVTRIRKCIRFYEMCTKFIYINSREWVCDVGVNYYREYGQEHGARSTGSFTYSNMCVVGNDVGTRTEQSRTAASHLHLLYMSLWVVGI